jgi:FixJ family two-component response regulator
MQLVFCVDDDPAVTRSLGRALREEGWEVETFDSAEAFLSRSRPERYGCLVLDVSMPGIDGLELQRRLRETGQSLPIVFLTGDGDIRMSVQAIKAGAADFLTKPVTSDALAHAVRTAFDNDAADRVARAERAMLEWHLATLTAREREVSVAGASEDSTSRSPVTSASSSRPSSSIARASWNARRRVRPPR